MSKLSLRTLPRGRYVSKVSFEAHDTPTVAPPIPGATEKSVRTVPVRNRASRMFASIIIGVLTFLLGVGGAAQAATTPINNPVSAKVAEAGIMDNILDGFKSIFCGPEAENYAAGQWSAFLGIELVPYIYTSAAKKQSFDKTPANAFEALSSQGARWTTYRGGNDGIKRSVTIGHREEEIKLEDDDLRNTGICIDPISTFETTTANQVFRASVLLSNLAMWVYRLALQPVWLDDLMTAVGDLIKGTGGNQGLKDVLYFPFINLMIMLGAIYLGWIGLVKRASMQAASSALWMIGAVFAGSLLMFNPQFLPSMANNIILAAEEAVATATVGAALQSQETSANDLCYMSKGTLAANDERTKVIRTMECSLWATFVYTPWVSGQFGVSPKEAAKIAEGEKGKDYNLPVRIGNREVNGNIALYQLNAQTMRQDVKISEYLSKNQEQAKDWFEVPDFLATHDTGQKVFQSWRGGEVGSRVAVATLSMFMSIFGLASIFVISMSILIYGLIMVMLIFVSVLFLLVGAHPGFGRGIALRWAEELVGTILKRIMAAAMLGMLMAFYAILLNSETINYGTKILAVIAVSIAAISFRKRLTEAFSNVKFGGTNAGFEKQGPNIIDRAGAGVGMAAIAGTAAIASGGVGKAASAAALRPGATRGTKALAGLRAIGSGAGRGMRAGMVSGRMSGASAVMGLSEGRRGVQSSLEKTRRTSSEKLSEHNEQQSRQEELRKQQDQIARDSSPDAIARRERERKRRANSYRNDYRANHKNAAWRQSFIDTYGFEPPNPDTHEFAGYGLRPNELTPALMPIPLVTEKDEKDDDDNNNGGGNNTPPTTPVDPLGRCPKCGQNPCVCEDNNGGGTGLRPDTKCPKCGKKPCICPNNGGGGTGTRPSSIPPFTPPPGGEHDPAKPSLRDTPPPSSNTGGSVPPPPARKNDGQSQGAPKTSGSGRGNGEGPRLSNPNNKPPTQTSPPPSSDQHLSTPPAQSKNPGGRQQGLPSNAPGVAKPTTVADMVDRVNRDKKSDIPDVPAPPNVGHRPRSNN